MTYRNGINPLLEVVDAYCEIHETASGQLSTEQLHDLADIITTARHQRHGPPEGGRTTETVVMIDRDRQETYRETITTPATTQGEK